MVIAGIDIGTSKICGAAVDAASGKILQKISAPNDAGIKSKLAFEAAQNPERILEICLSIYGKLKSKHKGLAAVGITGQMHGILYVGAAGQSVSPLYTWQDGRGGEIYKDGQTHCQSLADLTGYTVPAGYGAATHYYNLQNKLVPAAAKQLTCIHSYVAMRLAGITQPLLHKSDAAAFGAFDLIKGKFDDTALKQAGIDPSFFPEVTDDIFVGKTADGIDITVAVGDNQASVFGSSDNDNAVIINIGTGSQVSLVTDTPVAGGGIEARPHIGGKYLAVGCGLCGGYSYSLLKEFFTQAAEMLGTPPPTDIYERMNVAALAAAGEKNKDQIHADTRFKGTRTEPSRRGALVNISPENFTPGQFALSITRGMSEELYELYGVIRKKCGAEASVIIGSGNAVRKNPLLRDIIGDMFSLKLKIPAISEEAAFGAALFALYCKSGDIGAARKLIKYEK